MKLRVRRAKNNRNKGVQGQQTDADSKTNTVHVTVPLGQERRDVTLSDLKKCVFDLYRGEGAHEREPQLWPKVQVSLNGKDELLYACQLELDFGLLDLDSVFAPYFDTDIDTLEEEDTKYIKAWFSTVQRAREESGFDYPNHDRVSDALRQWVGLSMEQRFRKKPERSR